MKHINFYNYLPKGILTTPINQLHEFLGGPSIVNIEGHQKETIFISTLLHGNETSGVLALNRFLKKYENKKPPVSLCILYGNTFAASKNMRHIPGEADWNRIWSPEELEDSPVKEMAVEIMDYASSLSLIANIDIHNNTGNNPPYGCINKIAPNFLKLAKIFDEKIIYFTEPHQVQSMSFAKFCPSMTIEAGLPGELQGIELILKFLNKLIKQYDFDEMPDPENVDLYHTVAKVTLPHGSSIDFENNQRSFSDFSLRRDMEQLNFQDLTSNIHWGFSKRPFVVTHHQGAEVFDQYFEILDGEIKTKKLFTPCMLTRDQDVLKSDCLCYIMEHINNPQRFLKKSANF